MIEIPDDIREFWRAFEAVVGQVAPDRLYEVFHFDDNAPTANALAELVVSGPKRATAGLLWSFEAKGRPAPRPGDLSVVTDWAGQPRCVIETTAVEIRPFAEVDDAFAAAEGEGDGSLRWWRDAHWRYFSRECQRLGREPSLQMPVVCERFALVYAGEAPPGGGSR